MGGKRRGLIDSNVLVAVSSIEHLHHERSVGFFSSIENADLVVAVHSLSEFYNAATRREPRGVGLTPLIAKAILDKFVLNFEILGLTDREHIEAIRTFSNSGGRGPLVYDFLIGQVALIHNIPMIITWNVKHMAPLFPTLKVLAPTQFIKES